MHIEQHVLYISGAHCFLNCPYSSLTPEGAETESFKTKSRKSTGEVLKYLRERAPTEIRPRGRKMKLRKI